MAFLNISNDLSEEGRTRVEVGQILMFEKDGEPIYLKIMRKENDQVFAKRLKPELFLTPKEADDHIYVVPKGHKIISKNQK